MTIRLTMLLACGWLCCAAAMAEIKTQTISYTHDGVALEGYLAYDTSREGKLPGVLVVHEWWGLNDYAKQRARMLAELGYVAFACDMYGLGRTTTDASEAATWAGQFRGEDTTLVRARARAGLDVLAKHDMVDADKLAAIGYCFGGSTVQHLALSGAPLLGVVSFHGSLVAPQPTDKDVQAAVLICHGAADAFISPEEIAAFTEGATMAGIDWQFVSYSGAVHSFTNPGADRAGIDGVAYQRAADRRSWAHMRAFFDELFADKE
jgi:dienelactone hydrolase